MGTTIYIGGLPYATTEAQLQEALSGVLCRCFGHVRMMRAIRRYARSREVRS